MIIRQARETDILEVSKLWLDMVKELAPDLTPNEEWWKKYASLFMKGDNYFMFVAEEEGRILGFIDYFLFAEPSTSKYHCVGQHLYVIPEHRENKVSGDLWKIAIKTSKNQGAQVHELFCFDKEQNFWEHHGFFAKRQLMRREN